MIVTIFKAQEQIDDFLSDPNKLFEDYMDKIIYLKSVFDEITIKMVGVVNVGMFEMNRADLINTLEVTIGSLLQKVIDRVVADYQNMCRK